MSWPVYALSDSDRALMEAAKRGQAEQIPALVNRGANVDVTNEDGQTPLLIAASNGYEDVVEVLLGAEADIKGLTLLWIAASVGNSDKVVALLQDTEADLNVAPADGPFAGATPLWMAAAGGHKDVVEALLDAGADVNAADVKGDTPLSAVIIGGHHPTIVLIILKKSAVDMTVIQRDVGKAKANGWHNAGGEKQQAYDALVAQLGSS